MQARRSLRNRFLPARYFPAVALAAAGIAGGAQSANAQSALLGSTVGTSFFSTYTFGNAALLGDNYGDAAVQGSLTAGGNAGFGETPTGGTSVSGTTTLFVNSNATFGGGNMTGSYNVGGSVSGSINQSGQAAGGNQVGSSATMPSFSSAQSFATNLNATLSGTAQTTGATTVYNGPSNATLAFNLPANSSLATYYFNVTDTQLNSISSGMTLNVNGWTAGSSGVTAPTIVINVNGTNASTNPDFYFPTNGGYTNFNSSYTVWNIKSSIAGFGVNGSVIGSLLAPGAILTIGSNPAVSGTAITAGIIDTGTKENFGQSGSFNGKFSGAASAPEPTSLALLLPLGALIPVWKRRRQA